MRPGLLLLINLSLFADELLALRLTVRLALGDIIFSHKIIIISFE